MRKSDKRQKASDVFREGYYPFVRKVSFAEAFPEIEDTRVEAKEYGYAPEAKQCWLYTREHPPGEYVDCSNPLCYNGGFSIASVLRQMARDGLTEHETSGLCQGNEGSPKGRRIYRKCMHSFEVKVTIKYKAGTDPKPDVPAP